MEYNIINRLIELGDELSQRPRQLINFTKDPEIDHFLNDIENYSHYFVLACVMDRQIKAERAWKIPYKISKAINSNDFKDLLSLTTKDINNLFIKYSLHRFNETMSECYYCAVQQIHNNYHDDASLIWKDNLNSVTIVRRFLQFKGVGIKIASMATNILAREFKIKMKDKICIDISPDVQVKRVFQRLGFISKNASNDEIIYCARELNPIYPGIFDLSVWEIGRNWCRPKNPKCDECYLNIGCSKVINNS